MRSGVIAPRILDLGIRMDLRQTEWQAVECIRMAQIRDQWRVLVTFGFHKTWEIF
jgi:hypothetical protein